jgi:hypothetical protein
MAWFNRTREESPTLTTPTTTTAAEIVTEPLDRETAAQD